MAQTQQRSSAGIRSHRETPPETPTLPSPPPQGQAGGGEVAQLPAVCGYRGDGQHWKVSAPRDLGSVGADCFSIKKVCAENSTADPSYGLELNLILQVHLSVWRAWV